LYWVPEVLPPEWSRPYIPPDLVRDMDRTGVDEAVIVTTALYGRGERANEYSIRSIEAHPDRLYGVAIMDFFDEDSEATRDSDCLNS
jgi:L-fuconolactonase